MKAAVEAAIAELRAGLPDLTVRDLADPDGGAFVIVDDVDIGAGFSPSISWIGFQITWTYPDSDVYPHFIDPGVRYVGGGDAPVEHAEGNLPTAMSRGAKMPGFELPAIQVSQRSNRRNADTDTSLCKLLRIIEFLRTR